VARRGRLFGKYVWLCGGLVSVALLANGLIEVYFSYREHQEALVTLEREKALAAATRIEQFIREIERQVGWASQPVAIGPPTVEQRRLDLLRLLRQAPAITEVSQLDKTGREELRVSRLAMDVVGSRTDFSRDPRFTGPKTGHPYLGPVYFRNGSEPYMTLAVSGAGGGVTAAEVNLKLIWDVVSQLRIGAGGQAFAVDAGCQLVAHPDISLVLKQTNLGDLPQVRAVCRSGATTSGLSVGDEVPTIARDLSGRRVLTAAVPIPLLKWWVFVEQPLTEVFAPLYASIARTAALLVAAIALAIVASLVLARRMVTPIRALEAGAARLGAGALDQRIDVRTGDELEALAEGFNRMGAQLQESYATLEHKVEERTRELTEALEQQTATAEILRVTSESPTDIQPVLDAVASRAARLCEAHDAAIFLVEGAVLRQRAAFGTLPSFAPGERRELPLTRGSVTGRAVLDGETIQVEDLAAASEREYPDGVAFERPFGHRTTLATPLLREGAAVGAILIRRMEVRAFAEKQVALLRTFAAQAVIAIENVRLFEELEARNHDLTEALEQQTATAEILRVISSSPTDLEPVFATILAKATQLCDAQLGAVFRVVEDAFEVAATHGASPGFNEFLRRGPIRVRPPVYRPGGPWQAVHLADVTATRAMDDPVWEHAVAVEGIRTLLGVPLVKDGSIIGSLMVYRREVRPFTDKQVQLVTTFATQAIIAIENARLFEALQTRTHELARSVEQLQALGAVGQAVSSTLDLETVLTTIVSRADQLSGTDGGAIYEYDEASETMQLRATQRFAPELVEVLRTTRIPLGEGAVGTAALRRLPVQIPDLLKAGVYHGRLREVLPSHGFRAALAVPLLRENRILGGLVVSRKVPGEFPPEVVDLLRTFATQSALAIQNARLFRELEAASRHKSEFLANMSHELRTPLNAIIGFSEVLGERMFGELTDKQAEYVQDILSSGRHLLELINDILDLSKVEAGRMELDLGKFDLPATLDGTLTLVRERATRRGLALELSVDPRLGAVVGDERKIRQVLLNLLSNAVKFTPEGGRISVRATLVEGAAEISVQDTGIGIAPADQALIFEEFRQAGSDYAKKQEGTGLGLALARRFVELHGGRLWVTSTLGEGATFTFTLPERSWPES